MKEKVFKTVAMLLLFAAIVSSCNDKRETEAPKELEDFCTYLKTGNMDKTMPFVDEFLSALSHDLTDEQKLDALAAWLEEQPCIVNALVECQSCWITNPRKSEIFISFVENCVTQRHILEVAMTLPLKAHGFRVFINEPQKPRLPDDQIASNLAEDGEIDPELQVGVWEFVKTAYTPDGYKISNETPISAGTLTIASWLIPKYNLSENQYGWYFDYRNSYGYTCSFSGNLIEFTSLPSNSNPRLSPSSEEKDLASILKSAYSFVIKGDELILSLTGVENKNLIILKKLSDKLDVYTDPYYVGGYFFEKCGYALNIDTWYIWSRRSFAENLPEEYQKENLRVIVTYRITKNAGSKNDCIDEIINIIKIKEQ